MASLGLVGLLAACGSPEEQRVVRAENARACALLLTTANDGADSLHRLRLPVGDGWAVPTPCVYALVRDTMPVDSAAVVP